MGDQTKSAISRVSKSSIPIGRGRTRWAGELVNYAGLSDARGKMTNSLIQEHGCKNCRHAFRSPQALECRLNPPVPFPIPTPQGLGFAAVFPGVQPDMKCSQHARGVVLGYDVAA